MNHLFRLQNKVKTKAKKATKKVAKLIESRLTLSKNFMNEHHRAAPRRRRDRFFVRKVGYNFHDGRIYADRIIFVTKRLA